MHKSVERISGFGDFCVWCNFLPMGFCTGLCLGRFGEGGRNNVVPGVRAGVPSHPVRENGSLFQRSVCWKF